MRGIERVAEEAPAAMYFIFHGQRHFARLARPWIRPELVRLQSTFAATAFALAVPLERDIPFRGGRLSGGEASERKPAPGQVRIGS